MDDLTKLRAELDKLDDQMLESFIRRFRVVEKIKHLKKEWRDKTDPVREQQMLQRWLRKTEGSLEPKFVETLLKLITDESKRLQNL